MTFRQDYKSIRNELRRIGKLFEDPEFEAIDKSVFYSKKPQRPFQWKRPGEIVENPRLFVDGVSRLDIHQGELGNCWFLAALSSLSQHKKLFYNVLPRDQGFSEDYLGIFRVRFWYYGKWVEVVIDDRLPTDDGRLVFTHSAGKNEFWSCLIEKAYAKLHGSYESLTGGHTTEAMEDFTGGITEIYELKDKTLPNLSQVMKKSFSSNALVGCSIYNPKSNEIEAKLNKGLVMGHAYTVTAARKVSVRNMEVELVRVRNPWGNEREWDGAWGDRSREWSLVSDEEKSNIELTYEDDGEFWMTWSDWVSQFDDVEICHLSPGKDLELMDLQVQTGTWRRTLTAGGCGIYQDTFHTNPQFILKVPESGEKDEDEVVIAVMQKDRRRMKQMGNGMLTIGFAIYKLEGKALETNTADKDFFLSHPPTAGTATYTNSREVSRRFSFPPGTYCIVPSTYEPDEPGDFIVRIYTPKKNSSSSAEGPSAVEYRPRPKPEDDYDEKFKSIFDNVAGNDEECDAFELQALLVQVLKSEMEGREVSLSCCRAMINMHDDDFMGMTDFAQFKELIATNKLYREVFIEYDTDNTGILTVIQLRGALAKLGFNLSTPALSKLSLIYANKEGRINIDDFLELAVKVKRTFDAYLSFQGEPFTIDDYLMKSV